MANPKQEIPDTEVAALIIAGCTNYQITKKFGKNPGCMHGQIKRLRERLGIPSPGRRGGLDLTKKETTPTQQLGTGTATYISRRKKYGRGTARQGCVQRRKMAESTRRINF